MVKDQEASKKLQLENKPLGPRHRIIGADRNRFKDIIEEITEDSIENMVKDMKPLKWRNCIVRKVCTAGGQEGNELRKLWVKIYKGDLRWGVRDARMKAKEKGWPRKDSNSYLQNQDRNSWIASSIRKSFLTEMKITEKKNFIKLL